MIAPATLTIGDRTFHTNDRVQTPEGSGFVIGLDPFADEEIGVQLDDGRLLWFAFCNVTVSLPALGAEPAELGEA